MAFASRTSHFYTIIVFLIFVPINHFLHQKGLFSFHTYHLLPHSILLFPIAFEIVSVARGTYQRLTTNLLYTRIPHHFHSALLSTTWHRLPKNHSIHRLTTRLYKTAFLSNRRNFFTQEHGKLTLTQRKDFTSVGVKRISRITVSNRAASPFSIQKKEAMTC